MVVVNAYAIVEPRAVMIKLIAAPVTLHAVMGVVPPLQHAQFAIIIQILFHLPQLGKVFLEVSLVVNGSI